jgi:predicted nucleic-acid-binding protein
VIAVDTNVLVRLLVKDDAAQTRKVVELFKQLDAAGETAFVSDVTVCELVWVLSAAYGFDRKQIAGALRQILAARQLTFQATDRLSHALDAFEAGRGDLADYVILEHAKAAGCDAVVTFDKALLKEAFFRVPGASDR